jgi:transcription initiation factor TFIID TATA-box-binding protein
MNMTAAVLALLMLTTKRAMSPKDDCIDPQETITITNVLASTNIGREIDLMNLATDLQDANYDPETFPGVIYRTQNPRGAALLFRSGKLVSTGTSSVENANAHLHHVFNDLRELGIEVPDQPEISIGNVVAGANLGERLNLNAIAIGLGLENSEYEPEQFPGLIYRVDDPPVVMLLFGTGKAVITDADTREEVEHAVERITSRLTELSLIRP